VADRPRLKVEFRRAEQYRIVPADGVWGSFTPSGDLNVEFYLDVPAVPRSIELEYGPQGMFEASRDEDVGTILREMQVAVLMKPSMAKQLGAWLTEVAETAEKAQASATDV
jgi:hypothetical protein